jgi:hypothetical protein
MGSWQSRWAVTCTAVPSPAASAAVGAGPRGGAWPCSVAGPPWDVQAASKGRHDQERGNAVTDRLILFLGLIWVLGLPDEQRTSSR